jgi:uncharacterized protein YndB with AHSA1/START domain
MEVRDDSGLVRELTISRVLRAPIDLVWEIWTDPNHVQAWWGPHGFTSPVCRWDPNAGNQIYIDMKGPDGKIGPVKGEFVEVLKPTRLVFRTHKMGSDGKPEVTIENTITLAAQGKKTRFELHVRLIMLTDAGKVPLRGINVGMKQSMDKMEDYLYSKQ